MKRSKVSVVIPTYNRQKELFTAIDTVIKQTYKGDIEIIVVDDSESKSIKTATKKKIGKLRLPKNRFIRYACPEKRAGAPSARNLGIKHSKGEFIAFLDDDDEWMSMKIEKQVDVMIKNPSVALVITGSHDLRFSNDRIQMPQEIITYETVLKSFNLSSTSSYMVRRQVIELVALGEGAKQFEKEYDRIEDDNKEFKVFYDYETGTVDSKKLKKNYPRLYKIMKDKASFAFDIDLKSAQEYDLAIRIAQFYDIACIQEVLITQHPGEGQISENWGRKISGIIALFAKHHKKYNILGKKQKLMQYAKTIGVLTLFSFGYIVGNRIYKIIIPIKEIYER